jgi:gliding motility-associated lipoprotein GldD
MKLITRLLLFLITLIFFSSCGGDEEFSPKPKGYFRIDLPQKSYTLYDQDCPFTFEYPKYARVVTDNERLALPCWLNLEFPHFSATLHLSYKELDKGCDQFIKDSWELAQKHITKASGMNNEEVIRKNDQVYGLVFNIEGNAASPLQFYLTDSIHNAIRGALYFNAVPNKDSIAPVFEFIRQDIQQMIKTFRWKKTALSVAAPVKGIKK